MSNLWMDDGQQDAWYGQGQSASQSQMNWGQFDYSQPQQQAPTQQFSKDQTYYQQQTPYTQNQDYYGGQMFLPNAGLSGKYFLGVQHDVKHIQAGFSTLILMH
ncbi:unnamed protein product [Strongylus vulgaris]|uniref:Uncharacterized protein n=1 Tax=Strongylus vulgaris TaxID=40348 RepID=A0A3P7LK74_STRVU|nr:unnamed protein product [Strongylus vulgaris]